MTSSSQKASRTTRAILVTGRGYVQEEMTDGPDFTPDPEEASRLAYHYGPGGPVETVYEWLRSVGEGDFAAVWHGMDDNYRLCVAQAWLWSNRTHPYVVGLDLNQEADRLVAGRSESDLWEHFAQTEMREVQQMCDRLPRLLDSGTLGAGSSSRVVGPDLEIVILMETDEVLAFDGATLVDTAFPFTVRMTDNGWKVAAFGDFVPEPGWPPGFDRPAE